MIRPATSEDGEAVTSLAFRSKAGWGYLEEMMAVFRDELRISGEQLVEQDGHVAEREGAIVGFYTLALPNPRRRWNLGPSLSIRGICGKGSGVPSWSMP
ncbi:MAG: hypothetical protein ABGZ37_14030 [Akkermansiaceae bacterium]